MSASLNSTNGSPSTEAMKELVEEVAELTQNHDEVMDLHLALGALGGLRHSAACEAAERSARRFDDRNHRLHESRIKDLGMEGMEGEEKEPEAEDMSQQVLIRSPTIHNHYANQPATDQPQQPNQPLTKQPSPGLSPGTKAVIGALVATSLLGPALGGYALYRSTGDTTTINQPIERAPGQNIGTLPPIPPDPKKAP